MRFGSAFATLSIKAAIAAALIGLLPPAAVQAADEPAVIAAVAVDPYADLKKQAKWVGAQIDQPTLDGFLESFIMMATQFKGLAGLDVNRPAGVVVTAEGPAGVPVPRGFVPVKDLGKLLAALQPIIGPAQEQDGVRVISPPGMPAIQIVEKDGWAIFSQQGSPDAPAGLEQALDPIVKAFSLGVQVFPARMPAGLRKQLQDLLNQAAAMQAQQGQPVDAEVLAAGLKELENVESILLGATVDIEKERVYLENRFAMLPDSAAGTLYGDMAKATPTVPATATADGKAAAVSGHAAMAIPTALREVAKAAIVQALPVSNRGTTSDGRPFEITVPEPANTIFKLLREVAPAMVDAGGLDAAVTIDTAAAEMAEGQAMPRVTAGMRVKDGKALEANLKAALGGKDALPAGVTAKFDAGKAGAANLHLVEIDLAAVAEEDAVPAPQRGGLGPGPVPRGRAVRALGAKLPIVLGVTPTHAFVAAGGDAEKRIGTAAGGGKADPDAKPLAGLDVSLAPLVAYAVGMQRLLEPDDEGIAEAADRAEEAAALPTSLVQLLVRPIERGVATRISADSGAIKILRLLYEARSAAPQPAGFGPGPVPRGRAIPLPGLAP
jgi:hypothetical protein